MTYHELDIPTQRIATFCREHGVRRLSLFGSILRNDFGPASDVDVLVEFEVGRVPGFLRMAHLELELSQLLGRKVDLRTPEELSRHFRQDVLREAVPQYVEA